MTLSRSLCLSTALFALSQPVMAHATDTTASPYTDRLLGNMWGFRDVLADHGVDLAIEYKADLWRLTGGGLKRGGNYLDNLDVQFTIDGEKAYNMPGNTIFVYFLNNNGSRPNDRIGSVQGVDNIEVGDDAFKLYEAWMEQRFWHDKASILVGLHDLNSEFYVTDLAGNFIHPAMGIGQEISQTGDNGPSIFPNASLAGRVLINPTDASYLQFAAFDGVPGNPDHPHGTHIDFEHGDGLLWIAEAGITPNNPDDVDMVANKFALGAWTYSERGRDLRDVDGTGDPLQRRREGIYALASHELYRDGDSGRIIGGFARAGLSDGDTAQTDWAYEIGLVGGGWVPARPNGEIGIGLAQAHNTSKFRDVMTASGAVADSSEYTYELYYHDNLTDSISIQPDLQYVVNPGTDPSADNATIIGVRIAVNF